MKGSEVVHELTGQDTGERCFIKWWRRENDFVDYELVDSFIEQARTDQDFAGYELLNLQQMWETLQRSTAGHVTREKRGQREVIVWTHREASGKENTEVCNFTPQTVMAIFDVETRGNVLDS